MKHTTATNRIVSNRDALRLQNIPIRTEEAKRIRDAFMSPSLGIDYGPIEERIAAGGLQPAQGIHYLISWVDTDQNPMTWPPHPQLLGYWKDEVGTIQEEGKDTPTATVHMTALVASAEPLNGACGAMDMLRELNWTPIRLLAVLTRPAGWYPDKDSRYRKPEWAGFLGRTWGG
jgi:hypothetical protein